MNNNKIIWLLIDILAIIIALSAFTCNLIPTKCLCFNNIICVVAGFIGLLYLIIPFWLLFFRMPKFDWHLVKGNYLIKVIALVLLFPSMITSGFLLPGIICSKTPMYSAKNMVFDENLYTDDNSDSICLGVIKSESFTDSVYLKAHNLYAYRDTMVMQINKLPETISSEQEDPSIFWAVFYHFIDPGNQHMTTSQSGRGWSALIAILGVFLLNGLLVSSIVGWIDSRKEKWLKGEVRYGWLSFVRKRVAVVIGANETTSTIIKNILGGYGEKQVNYVILLTNGNVEKVREEISSYLSNKEEKKVIIYSGQLDSIEEIYKLQIKKATEIYVLGENSNDDISQSYHDAQNMRCVHNIASYLTNKCVERKIVCRVSFEYQTTYSVFQFSDLPDNIRQHLVFIPFNAYENWAQRVFVKGEYTESVKKILPTIRKVDLQPVWFNKIIYPMINYLQSIMPKDDDGLRTIKYTPLDGTGISKDSKENVHFVVVGMSKMGIAMAIQAAQVAHYPNFSSGKKNNEDGINREASPIRTKITFIDENADNEMNFFMGRYQNLFALSRYRFIDATCIGCNLQPEWVDPMQESDCEYKLHGNNFLDIEWEFVKGGIESPGVMKYLKEAACAANKNNTSYTLLTIAICHPMTHEAIASALYMPNEVYDYAQQILVYQREASDIIFNLSREEEEFKFKRYSKLRPFGMQYADFTMDKNNYYRSQLCNYVYKLMFDDKIDNRHIPDIVSNMKISQRTEEHMKKARDSWKVLPIFNKWSNRYLSNSFETKLRSINASFTDVIMHYDLICELFEKNKIEMAECEHNRWNVQQLLMGFRAYKDDELEEFENLRKKSSSSNEAQVAFKEFKDKMKNSPEKVHLNICSISMLHTLDKNAEGCDEVFNASIPAILICIENNNKEIS